MKEKPAEKKVQMGARVFGSLNDRLNELSAHNDGEKTAIVNAAIASFLLSSEDERDAWIALVNRAESKAKASAGARSIFEQIERMWTARIGSADLTAPGDLTVNELKQHETELDDDQKRTGYAS